MIGISVLILSIIGCGFGGDGVGEVRSSEDAPWSMDAAGTFLWNPGDFNDGSSGQGALFIAVDSIECDDLGQSALAVRARKRGLVFRLGYITLKGAEVEPPAWDGLYLTGGADTMGQVEERTLQVDGWKNGSIFGIDGESWVEIDEGNEETFRGTFATPWWTGSFAADVCPSEPVDAGEDSG